MAHSENLTDKQMAALTAIITGGSVDEAAALAGVSRRQVYRWVKDEAFSQTLMRVRLDALSNAAARLAGLSLKAVNTLEGILDDPGASASTRLRAAQVVLDTSLRWAAQLDTEYRLQRLEQWLEHE